MMEKWTHCVLGLTNRWHMALLALAKPSLLLVQILTINEITRQWNANFPRNDRAGARVTAAPQHSHPSHAVSRPGSVILSYCDLTLAWTQLKLWGYYCGELLGLVDIMVQVMVLLGLWMLYSVWFLVFFWHIKDTCENWLCEWQQL